MEEYANSENHSHYILVSYENDNSNLTKITTDYSYFTKYEIDEKEEIQAVDEYVFDTEGEHLVKLYLNDPTLMGDGIFQGCDKLLKIRIPNTVTSIGNNVFQNCTSLTSVTIGTGVTTISQNAFYGCSGLTNITIPDSVTSIGVLAFYNCSGLTSVTIGNGVTTIGQSAFSGCSNLTSVAIPNTVTTIESYAFGGGDYASSYPEIIPIIENLVIPNSVIDIGSNAFINVQHIEYHGTATGAPWGALSMN
jgi:hypothetical protein